MTTLITTLSDRRDEFHVHLALAQSMDKRLFEGDTVSIGETILTARHLLTVKSGLIIHLYNIVEAVMTRTIDEVGQAVRVTSPQEWTTETLREWLRSHASIGIEGNEDSRLNIVHEAALKLLTINPINELRFKKPSGSWSDKLILEFSRRLNVNFPLTPDIARKIAPSSQYGDMTPLEFLADRRNAIAHGRRSFENGASDLTLSQIQNLANVTIDYMECTVNAFQVFLNEQRYRVAANQ